jgi:hypothetical protein
MTRQSVHGSSLCAPTIKINELAGNLNIRGELKRLLDNAWDNICGIWQPKAGSPVTLELKLPVTARVSRMSIPKGSVR